MIALRGVAFRKDEEVFDCLFHWRNDPNIYQWCRQSTLLSLEEHRRYWERIQLSPNDKMFFICHSEDDRKTSKVKLIGACGLTNINWTAKHAEFSLFIAPEFQKQGHGKAALSELIKIGFNDLGLHKIWGESFEGNPAIKMFKSFGFEESPGHQDHYFKNGRLVSTKFYTLFNPLKWE